MKSYRLKHTGKAAALVLAVALIAIASCGRSDRKPELSAHDMSQAVPEGSLNAVAKSISTADARAFASYCSYPIMREYPLRDIADSAGMVKYFNVIFDDSVRQAFGKMNIKDWQSYGWRGWSPSANNELWWNDGVYAINYHSAAENAMRAMLADEEISTIAPELRAGWVPSFCLHDSADSTIYRVDFHAPLMPKYNDEADSIPEQGDFRMSVYPKGSDLHLIPSRIMPGKLKVEGSAGVRTYTFRDKDGTIITFSPDEAESVISITTSDSTREHPVRNIYWRDYVALPQ